MIFICVDTETTGLNPRLDQILEIGAVLVDTNRPPDEWREFKTIVRHDFYRGDSFAINMNARIFDELTNGTRGDAVTDHGKLDGILGRFISESLPDTATISYAGKNPGFDLGFLNEVRAFGDLKIRRRLIDPSILYTDFLNDKEIPELAECKRRAGLPDIVTHNALEDAWDVVLLLAHRIGIDTAAVNARKYSNGQ